MKIEIEVKNTTPLPTVNQIQDIASMLLSNAYIIDSLQKCTISTQMGMIVHINLIK